MQPHIYGNLRDMVYTKLTTTQWRFGARPDIAKYVSIWIVHLMMALFMTFLEARLSC